LDADNADPAQETPARKPDTPRAWPPGYALLWLVALASLLLNAVILRQLVLARQIARQSVQDSIAILEDLQNQVIDYDFVVSQELPVQADIPVQQTVPIQIDEDFPLDTTVTVSVPTPLGTLPVQVPISTVVPIHRTVRVTIDDTFTIDTSVPLNLTVPVTVSVASTPLYATLEETKARLLALEASLNRPLLPFLGGSRAAQPTSEPTATP
jgi:hypothetical protein